MPFFRKKPVTIEARRFDGSQESARDIVTWMQNPSFDTVWDKAIRTLSIQTLEGVITASPGDWIIRGVQGEHYPCKPDIFEATYESVEESR